MQLAVQTLESLLNALENILLSSPSSTSENGDGHGGQWVGVTASIGDFNRAHGGMAPPIKLVNHVASSVYQRLLDTLALYIKCKGTDSKSGMGPCSRRHFEQPLQHRSRYHAITLLVPPESGPSR